MFTSVFNLETIVPRVQSRQAQTVITLDFDQGRPAQEKRSSFLPSTWIDDDYSPGRRYTSLGTSVFSAMVIKPGERTTKQFCTGSKYIGEYNKLGMTGKGIYKYPHGVIYDGYFNKKGEFHGSGSLIYPGGQRVEGIWRNGKLVKGASCVTADNISFASEYCRMPDRRFQIEVQKELAAAGQEYLTNSPNPPREIRKDCYDSGEGYFNPKQRIIYDYTDANVTKPVNEYANIYDENQLEVYKTIMGMSASQEYLLSKFGEENVPDIPKVISIPHDMKEKWIMENCRKAWDEPLGYKKELYENWTTGKTAETRLCQIFHHKRTEHDKIIEELAMEIPRVSENRPTLYSFIMGSNALNKRKTDSLSLLNKILEPVVEDRPSLKATIPQHSKKYRHKSIRSYKSQALSSIKKTDLKSDLEKHFLMVQAVKSKVKSKKEK